MTGITRIGLTAVVAGFCLAWLAKPASSQASFSTTYDRARQVKIEGTVTNVAWSNPRAFLFINVRDKTGTTVNWAVEIGSPLDLETNGWQARSLRIGDRVVVEGFLERGERRQAFATAVLTATGKPLFGAPKARAALPVRGAVPRWPDGQVRLGPPAGKRGYWESATATAMVENGAKIATNADGLLTNLGDADQVAPFQPWAKAVYEYRQRTLLKDDPAGRCVPPGGPRQFQTPHGLQFVEQRDLGRILVLLGGGNRNWRVIHTDGRAQGQPADVVLSYYGNSVGHWDKDTLVVDSIGFNEKFWFARGGLPHTEALHLVERFTRRDLATLRYDVTVEDPRTYTRPWSAGWTLQWVLDREIQEYFCEE